MEKTAEVYSDNLCSFPTSSVVLLKLDPTKNLVSQCVQGSGMVQINVEVKSQPGEKVIGAVLWRYAYVDHADVTDEPGM